MKQSLKFLLTLLFIVALFCNAFCQTKWTKDPGNPIMRSVDYSWDFHMISPFVSKQGDIYKMWYTGINTNYRVGYATSSDGITWNRYDNPGTTSPLYAQSDPVLNIGEPDSWDDYGLFGPQIIFDGSTYHMWYGGWDGTLLNTDAKPLPLNIRLGYATSSDGINWDKYPTNPIMELGAEGSWDADGTLGVSMMYKDSLFHLWYSGINGINTSIGYATSVDGISWEKYLDNPVLEAGNSTEWDSLLVYYNYVIYNPDSARFEMWYAGGVTHEERHIGYATSPDGITWTKYHDNPVLSPGPEDWDSHRFSGSHVMLTDEGYKMWYGGKGPTPPGYDVPDRVQIGYATAPIDTSNVIIGIKDLYKNFPNKYVLKQNYPNPFNPSTILEFTLPNPEKVILEVYNTLGQKVETLLNKQMPAGNNEVEFNGNNLPSGIYFYKLKAGEFQDVKKMVLLK